MRRFAVPIALALVIAGTTAALADGGLPEVANLQVGPFTAALHNDAPTLLTGSNTLTVEVPALPNRHAVSLSLTGPHGQQLDVPLRPVRVLETSADEHSGGHAGAPVAPSTAAATNHAHDASATIVVDGAVPDGHESTVVSAHDMATMNHDMSGMSHDAPVAFDAVGLANASPNSTHTSGGTTYLARGSASIPETGTWKARLVVLEAGGESFVAEAPLVAEEGGPNRLYLAGTGTLMGGFILYGVTLRRRRPPTPQKTRSLQL